MSEKPVTEDEVADNKTNSDNAALVKTMKHLLKKAESGEYLGIVFIATGSSGNEDTIYLSDDMYETPALTIGLIEMTKLHFAQEQFQDKPLSYED